MEGVLFHEAWDKFQPLLIQCPHHYYPLQLLNQFFYDGLTPQCQYIVDNVAGGAMEEKIAKEIVELYQMLGSNSQQKSARGKKGCSQWGASEQWDGSTIDEADEISFPS